MQGQVVCLLRVFTAVLLWLNKAPGISTAPLFLKCHFSAGSGEALGLCSGTMTWELSAEVPRLCSTHGLPQHEACVVQPGWFAVGPWQVHTGTVRLWSAASKLKSFSRTADALNAVCTHSAVRSLLMPIWAPANSSWLPANTAYVSFHLVGWIVREKLY